MDMARRFVSTILELSMAMLNLAQEEVIHHQKRQSLRDALFKVLKRMKRKFPGLLAFILLR